MCLTEAHFKRGQINSASLKKLLLILSLLKIPSPWNSAVCDSAYKSK